MTTSINAPPTHPSGLPDIVTSPELAHYSNVHVSTICRRAKRGELPYLRKLDGLRGPYLFDRDTVLPRL